MCVTRYQQGNVRDTWNIKFQTDVVGKCWCCLPWIDVDDQPNSTASKRVLILRTWSLIRTFLAFWVLIGSLFIFQGPYFHCFDFIHAKNVNSVCMYTTMSYLDLSVMRNDLHCYYTYVVKWFFTCWHYCRILIFTYAYTLNFINCCFGCRGSLLGTYFKKVGSLSQSLGVTISFRDSVFETAKHRPRTFNPKMCWDLFLLCDNTGRNIWNETISSS